MIERWNSTLPIRALHLGMMATALSLGVVIWQLTFHVAFAGERNSILGHFIHAVGDTALLLPLALFVTVFGLIIGARFGLDIGNWRGLAGSASVISVLFFFGAIPGVSVHGFSQESADRIVEGFSETSPVTLEENSDEELHATKSDLSEASLQGFHDAAASQIVVLAMMILGPFLLSKSGNLPNGARRREPR